MQERTLIQAFASQKGDHAGAFLVEAMAGMNGIAMAGNGERLRCAFSDLPRVLARGLARRLVVGGGMVLRFARLTQPSKRKGFARDRLYGIIGCGWQ